MSDLPSDLRAQGERVRMASRAAAQASTEQKNSALLSAADLLLARNDEVLEANGRDVETARAGGTAGPTVDRLRLTEARVSGMASGLRQVADLPDPVGEVLDGWVRPNGLRIRRVRVPLGVVGVIYENRPNVTSDAAALCLKAGNAAFLRGSAAAIESNRVIASVLREAAGKSGLPTDVIALVDDTSREGATEFMRLDGVIDCLIPRGGPSLITAIKENATVPYVIDGDGNCHVYVDAAADLEMAERIVVNGKTQRPSVCNATESLLVHRAVADELRDRVADGLAGVELRGDWGSPLADDGEWGREYLDLVLKVKVVDSVDEAIDHINRYGTGHTEAIVTGDLSTASAFQQRVDAAAVLVNCSTRFTDGEEFGFGAEIGISTQKLHARGPMGLRELTTLKYLVDGDGQIRT